MIIRRNKKPQAIKAIDNGIIKIQFGAYYSSERGGEFSVFRLIDLTIEAYHIQFFEEKFDHLPSFNEVRGLSPVAWHIPIKVGGLLNEKNLTLLGHRWLTRKALSGYEEFLLGHGSDKASTDEVLERIIEFSKKVPVDIKLVGKKGEERVSIVG